MLTTLKGKLFAAACVVFLLSLGTQYGPQVLGKSHVTKAVIVEETNQRSSLPISQRITLLTAPDIGVEVVDQDIVGPDKKPPPELVPFLKAASGKPLPQLAKKWASGQTTSTDCPLTMDKLKEAVNYAK